ncbi:MAG TPA: nitrogen fixation protein NifZ [Rhodocyclaceae bacterium]|jgi:nitrogen fixation protein NifZ
MQQFDIGDMVFAMEPMYNDGFIPELPEDALLAPPGTVGVVVMFGYAEADPGQEIYLVRFEGDDGILGPPVGCLTDEIFQDETKAKALLAAWKAAGGAAGSGRVVAG